MFRWFCAKVAKAEKKFWKYFHKSAKNFRKFLGTDAKTCRFNFKEKYCVSLLKNSRGKSLERNFGIS
jgi:hypothetical protein